jgi:hypothetical protein
VKQYLEANKDKIKEYYDINKDKFKGIFSPDTLNSKRRRSG